MVQQVAHSVENYSAATIHSHAKDRCGRTVASKTLRVWREYSQLGEHQVQCGVSIDFASVRVLGLGYLPLKSNRNGKPKVGLPHLE